VGFGCGWAKLNVLQKRWFVRWLAALLILRSVGVLSSIFSTVADGLHGRPAISANGLGLKAGGQLELLHCQPLQK